VRMHTVKLSHTHILFTSMWETIYNNAHAHTHTVSAYLFGPLVEHLACAGELVRVRSLPPRRGGGGGPGSGLLPGGGLGHLVGETGAAGVGHGGGATAAGGHGQQVRARHSVMQDDQISGAGQSSGQTPDFYLCSISLSLSLSLSLSVYCRCHYFGYTKQRKIHE